jgi:hypothetical protein
LNVKLGNYVVRGTQKSLLQGSIEKKRKRREEERGRREGK